MSFSENKVLNSIRLEERQFLITLKKLTTTDNLKHSVSKQKQQKDISSALVQIACKLFSFDVEVFLHRKMEFPDCCI